MDVKFSPDGTCLAVAGGIGILLYDTQTYDKPDLLKGHTGYIWCIAFRPDGKVLASAGQDRTVRLWDVNTRQQIRTFGINVYPTSNITFSPDGKTLASATGGNNTEDVMNVYLWDADTGKRLRTLSGHTSATWRFVRMEICSQVRVTTKPSVCGMRTRDNISEHYLGIRRWSGALHLVRMEICS